MVTIMSLQHRETHLTRLATSSLAEVMRIQYERPKCLSTTPKKGRLLADQDADGLPYLFDKSFRDLPQRGASRYFGLNKRHKHWYFELNRNGHREHHRLARLTAIRFFRDNCVQITRKPDEYLYIYFFGRNSLAYRALYHALRFLILCGKLSHLTLSPWLCD